MSIQRFTPEFKAEAVRQVIERGYSVAEIAARFGVSTHSLYKWGKGCDPRQVGETGQRTVGSQERNPAAAGPNASP